MSCDEIICKYGVVLLNLDMETVILMQHIFTLLQKLLSVVLWITILRYLDLNTLQLFHIRYMEER